MRTLTAVIIISGLVTLYGTWFGLYLMIINQGHKGQLAAYRAFGPLWCMIGIGIALVLVLAGSIAIRMIKDTWIDYRSLNFRIPKSFRLGSND